MIVHLSKQFENGLMNTLEFRDFPYFDDVQVDMLADFIASVRADNLLVGKNKTSWQDNQGNIIPETVLYQQHNAWHYHSGEYAESEPECYTYNLEWNIKGLKSSAVIHYQKITAQEILLLAYSPKHIPFPKMLDPNNPLSTRFS
ncbi:hypothetical protein [Lonepinella koalarum]|uniref:Uncharacterized protein n=1 Tax=Lonepinella koalarum TaxID=53417 RepID=A0A4R1KZN8_9PAST|nr:hypothetical protein [Lonepinella koalarum]MDH2927894.1 hypothetical protein [Lonepinella koalarum]TCK70090.1 hypothetical protein EV692_1316 [Lonepinella koalarum]TFJ90314.1 hypothetical protein E0709_02945 [Lonepinella koalarum]